MWSRRHFADARPAGILFLQNLFCDPHNAHAKTTVPQAAVVVVDNLAAIALPLRRLRLAKLRSAQ
jgi:hypothetical protein